MFIGMDDGRDQVQPVLALDADGNAYLAYADRALGRILVSKLRGDAGTWTLPMALTTRGTVAESPTLLIVRDQLVVAYSSEGQVKVMAVPLTAMDGIASLDSIVDHPDPVEYIPPPGDKSPSDGWQDGRWIIGDEDRPTDVMILPGRGPVTSGGTRR